MRLKCRFGVLEAETMEDLARMYDALGRSELEQLRQDTSKLKVVRVNGSLVEFNKFEAA